MAEVSPNLTYLEPSNGAVRLRPAEETNNMMDRGITPRAMFFENWTKHVRKLRVLESTNDYPRKYLAMSGGLSLPMTAVVNLRERFFVWTYCHNIFKPVTACLCCRVSCELAATLSPEKKRLPDRGRENKETSAKSFC